MSRDNRWAIAELVATVVLPAVTLLFLTSEDRLGPLWGLVVALTPPLVWSILSMVREGKISVLAVIAVVSVLMTGGVGLLRLDSTWYALKEALVPAMMGVGAIATASTEFAVVGVILDRVLDFDKVRDQAGDQHQLVDTAVRTATFRVGVVLLATAVVTWVLSRWVVVSEGGTEAFADELGRYTLLSVPVLMIPSTIAMAWVLNQVFGAIEAATGEEPESFLR